jgi:spore coat polysaccharide biosynthesis protein SpsF
MRIYNFEHPELLFNRHRWTLDYAEDYELIKSILEALYKEGELFSTQNILDYLAMNPELPNINAKYLPS